MPNQKNETKKKPEKYLVIESSNYAIESSNHAIESSK